MAASGPLFYYYIPSVPNNREAFRTIGRTLADIGYAVHLGRPAAEVIADKYCKKPKPHLTVVEEQK